MKTLIKFNHFPKFISNVSYLFIGRILSLAFQFLSGILVARLLGPEQKGIITVALVIPGLVISLADLGLRQATMFFMGKKIYSDQDLISSITFTTFITSFLGIFSAFIIYLVTRFNFQYGWLVTLIPLGSIPLTFIYTYSTGILLAKLEIKKVAFVGILNDVGFLIFVALVFIFNIKKLEIILGGKVLCAIIPAIVSTQLIKVYGKLKPSFQPKIILDLLKKGIIYAIALFLLGLNFSLDMVILNKVANATEVGIYSIGVSIAEILWLLPNALTTVNFSYSSNAQSEVDYAKKTTLVLRITLLFGLVFLLLLYLISPTVIPWLFSSQFARSSTVVQAILPGVWFMLIYKILNSDLAGRGKPGAGIWVCLLAVIVNILLNYWWDPIYGAIGSAWASNVSYALAAIFYSIVYCRLSNINLREVFLIKSSDISEIGNLIKRI